MDERRIKAQHIAPCGMDCALCYAYQRAKKPCPGCNGADEGKPGHCLKCGIKTCEGRAVVGSCTACAVYPCKPLKNMDARYQNSYYISILQNLAAIRDMGMEAFLDKEEARATCPSCGGIICIHHPLCQCCGASWLA